MRKKTLKRNHLPEMPRRYKRKKKYVPRRKPRRKRRTNNANNMGFVSGMPKVRRARLRYSDTVSITSSAGGLGFYKFRANSVFDPDFDSTGHQPMGFDQWAQLYNHYIVVGAKITIKSLAGTLSSAAAIGCYISDDTSLPYTSLDGFIEAKRGSWRTMSFQRTAISLYTNFSTKKFFNVTDVKDNFDRLGALVGENPSESAFFNIYYVDLNGDTTSVNAMVTIDYIVDFSEPKDMVQS